MAGISHDLAAQRIFMAGTAESLPTDAPVLRLLADMPAPSAEELRNESDFSILFRETLALDAAGFTMALCANGDVTRSSVRDRAEYRARWRTAPRKKRVFLSFTRRDLAHARRVQNVLEQKGLVVFTYLANEDNKVWTNSVDVGHYFDSAGHHLVVDTPNARASVATRFEQLALTDLWHRSSRVARSMDEAVAYMRRKPLFSGQPKSHPEVCCRACVAEISPGRTPDDQCDSQRRLPDDAAPCGALMCGPQCQNAY